MRKLFFFILTITVLSVFADGIKIVIRHQNGKGYYMEKDSIDSVFFVIGHRPSGEILRIDARDTVTINDTTNIVDTLILRDTLRKTDTLCVHDTLTNFIYTGVVSTDKWNVNIENPVVADYMNEVDYSDDLTDYSYTKIDQYCYTPAEYRKDQPRGIRIQWDAPGKDQMVVLLWQEDSIIKADTIKLKDEESSVDIYNLLPGKRYDYKVYAGESLLKQSHFNTQGQVRMMYLPSLHNVRDLGGWKTDDGKRIKYGRLFRGGEMNNYYDIKNCADSTHNISSLDSLYMHDNMNIRLDLDLRGNRDMNLNDTDTVNDRNHTELGKDVEYHNEQLKYYNKYFKLSSNYCIKYGNALSVLIKTLANKGNVYFHCIWGADRTGVLAMLIEGLLGVLEEDLSKDFELTNMVYGGRTRNQCDENYWKLNMAYIKSLSGESLKDKFANYCMKTGVTQEEIDTLRNIMLE